MADKSPDKERHIHFGMVISRTKDEMEIGEVISEAVGGAVTAFLALMLHVSSRAALPEALFYGVIGGVAGPVVGFLFRVVFVTPGKMYWELEDKLEIVESRLDKLQATKPQLELLPSPTYKDIDGKYFCRIVVNNRSTTGTARLVKAELMSVHPSPDLRRWAGLFGEVPYPFWLRPCDPDGATIHPTCASQFDVFMVQRAIKGDEIDNVSSRIDAHLMGRPALIAENYKGRFVICEFHPELVDEKKSLSEIKEHTVKIRISAEDFTPIEKTFRVLFNLKLNQSAVQIF